MNEIEAIENIKKVDICCNAAETARDLAVQALQEKLERENGCEYCKGGGNAKNLIDGETTVFITSEDKVFCADWGGDGYLEFSYCPMCGRKLSHTEPKHIGEATNMLEGE